MKVTTPVALTVPINLETVSLLVETPTWYLPASFDVVVEIPARLIISVSLSLWETLAIPINELFPIG